MKKLILIMSFTLIGLLGFSQATPTEVLRIANATTAMGKNLSTGKLVYNIHDSILYVTNSGVLSTLTLTTGYTKFTQIGGEVGVVTEVTSTTTNQLTVANGTTTPALTIVTGAVADNGTALATGDQIHDYVVGLGYAGDQTLSTNGTAGDISISGGNNITLNVNDADASSANEGDLSVTAGTGTTSVIHSNTSGSTDITITAGTGIGISEDTGTGTITLTTDGEANLTFFSEKFEETSSTAISHTLSHTCVGGATVALNGAMLENSTSYYTLTTTTIKIELPVLQYDIVTISYNY